MQEHVKLLEYSVTTVTEGVDPIATARVVICRENNHASRPASPGENGLPTFRYGHMVNPDVDCFSLACSLQSSADTTNVLFL